MLTPGMWLLIAIAGLVLACLALLAFNGCIAVLEWIDDRPARRAKRETDREWAAIVAAIGGDA